MVLCLCLPVPFKLHENPVGQVRFSPPNHSGRSNQDAGNRQDAFTPGTKSTTSAMRTLSSPKDCSRANEYCTRAYPVRLEVPRRTSLAFVLQMAGNVFSSMPLSLSRYRSTAMREQIATVLNGSQFDSVVCDFLSPAPNFETLANCVLFQHNVETMIWRRHAENAPDPLRKLYFKLQAERMFRWERHMCRAAAEVIAVSPQDAALMREMFGVASVFHDTDRGRYRLLPPAQRRAF